MVALAEPYPPDAPLFALALEDSPALRDYFERLRDVRLEVDGDRPGRARAGRVAARGGGARGAAPPEAERRARRPRLGARGGEGADRPSDPLGARAGPVRGRLLDARRRGQRGPVRLAQPRPRDRRRARAGGREPPAPLRRGRRRPGCAGDELPAPLDRRPARQGGLARRARRRALDGRARAAAAGARGRLPADRARPGERRQAGAGGPARRLARPARGESRRRVCRRSAAASSPRSSGPGSARAATRWGRRWPRRFAARSGSGSCATASSTSGAPPSGRLRAAGCARVDRVDLCTACTPERFFSHRRDEGIPGGRESLALSPETVRANYERIRGELGPEVTIVAATKYVARRGPRRARRGRDRGRRREPRAGPRRQARPARRRLPLALHRPPAEPQGGDRERALRALPLALERVGGEAADDPRARRGQPLRRGVEVGDPGAPSWRSSCRYTRTWSA